MKKYLTLLLTGILSISLFSACGSDETEDVAQEAAQEVTETATPEPIEIVTVEAEETAEPTPTPEEKEAKGINPFTGEPMDEKLYEKRPYAFMINNISSAMPQVGVSQSDFMIEMMDEGGITRMMAFYQDPSEVPVIGSIRSARGYNVETAFGYDALLAHCGSSDEGDWWIHRIYEMEDIDQIDGSYGEDVFYRDPERSASLGSVHSLMARGEGIVKSAEERDYRLEHPEGFDCTQGFAFMENAESQCTEDASHIEITYNGGKTTTAEYDPETKQYTLYQYGGELLDNNEEKVPFTNVVMIYANTFLQDDGLHLTIELFDGDGIFFTGGRAVPITWHRKDSSDKFHYYLEDGSEIRFNTGRTFLAVNQSGSYQGSCEYN